jgi:RNA polymerase sigma-70 factor, ECF subfamily
MEDLEIIQKLRKGDEESFRLIVDRYQRFILNTCNKFVYDKETAEDLTQEVFIEIYKSINLFRMDSKLSTWIYRIAITKSLDLLKSRKRKKRSAVLKSLFGDDNMEEKISAPEELNPQRELENQERFKILLLALNKLPENQRVAFTLSKYDELSYQEIADILGTSISAVESLIHRAKINLKKKLYNYYKKHL